MITILVEPRLTPPGLRIVILVVILVVMSRLAPNMAAPVGVASWLVWLAARLAGEPVPIPLLGRAG